MAIAEGPSLTLVRDVPRSLIRDVYRAAVRRQPTVAEQQFGRIVGWLIPLAPARTGRAAWALMPQVSQSTCAWVTEVASLGSWMPTRVRVPQPGMGSGQSETERTGHLGTGEPLRTHQGFGIGHRTDIVRQGTIVLRVEHLVVRKLARIAR